MTQGHGMEQCAALLDEEAADEMLLMGLRLREGLDMARWEKLAGRGIDPARLAFLAEAGFVERIDDTRIRATPSGFLVLDAVVADLAA